MSKILIPFPCPYLCVYRKVSVLFELILGSTFRHLPLALSGKISHGARGLAEFSTYGWQDEMFQKTRMMFV